MSRAMSRTVRWTARHLILGFADGSGASRASERIATVVRAGLAVTKPIARDPIYRRRDFFVDCSPTRFLSACALNAQDASCTISSVLQRTANRVKSASASRCAQAWR